jgi:heme oxygenase
MVCLKNGTLQAHKHLEKSECFKRLFADDYQIDEYARLIGLFYGYFAAIEPLIYTELPAAYHGSLQYRSKIKLLRQDLQALQMPIENLPLCSQLPPVDSFNQKLGVMYVLEGSSLGGRIISGRLRKQFGEDIGNSLHYYQSYGASLDKEWQRFGWLMSRYFSEQNDVIYEETIAAANATFTTLQNWVSPST